MNADNNPSPNPLLDASLEESVLPDFDAIEPAHVLPAVRAAIAETRAWVQQRMEAGAPYTWADTIEPLEALDDRMSRIWGPVSHLHSVMDSPELRAAYNAAIPELTDLESELGQNRNLYRAHQAILERGVTLERSQRVLLEHAVRDFQLSGVALEGKARNRFREVARELAQLNSRFEENLLDAEQAWQLHCEEGGRLRGVPEQALARAAAEAKQRELSGWVFTLDHPAYDAIMSHCEDRGLRQQMYEAWVTRASDRGPTADRFDNSDVMRNILNLRQEEAGLLGFVNFAELSLVPKMAASADAVETFLMELLSRAREHALEELREVRAFAHKVGTDVGDALEPWDLAYWSERLREQSTGVSEDALRPYFPMDAVLDGLFEITEHIFGVQVREVPPPARTWHLEVRYFELRSADGALIGGCFLDAYARPGKRGGAWMDDCITRYGTGSDRRAPIAHLVCNFTPPQGEAPSLLSHDEVLTLLHEFGHGLHHLLTEIDIPSVGGINGVAWDVVELPSQFMENFAWTREGLDLLSCHVDNEGALPDTMFEQLLKTRRFQSGLSMLRQIEFSLFDIQLHRDDAPGSEGRVAGVLKAVQLSTSLVDRPEFERFAHGFSHIFAGGYAAGYYGYKWAEVLSSDAFGAFEEAGVLDPETGDRFRRSILAVGATVAPEDMFRSFRGRDPDPEALLRHSGLSGSARSPNTAAQGVLE